jgi:glycosyltransferase involved in cell wall biosynthesis
MLRNNDGVIAVSNAVKEHGVRLGVPPQKLTMVPNGVDLDKFKPKTGRKKEGGKIKIAYIGRLVYNKGPDYLVKAAPKVLEECPSAGFIIIGDGPMRSVLERKVENLGIDHAFKFLGIISGVEKVLPQCDILVRPSLLEGMPLTVLEAMACAIPVVASRVAGTVELIKDGETGLLIDPGDAAQLSKALTTLIKDEGKRLALGKNARRYVERHFSWDKAAVQTLETYKKIVEEHEGIVA